MARLAMLLRPVLVVVLVAALLLALVWLAQRRLIYFPGGAVAPPAGQVIPGAADVTLHTSDGLELGAWLVPPTDAPRGATVLVANGNAGDRTARAPLATALAAEGFAVLLFDYRGYGGNPGRPTEAGLAHDADAAYRFLADSGTPAERIVYYGESLGAAVVTGLATRHPPGALVLRSPFVDLASVGAAHYPFLPVRALLRDRYPVAEQVATVRVPTAVVYGTADTVVPPEQSRQVARRAGGPVHLVPVAGADHNDATLLNGAQLLGAVAAVAPTGR